MDLKIGQTASRELTVTEEMVLAYAEITGDYNPLHFDSKFAARTRFQRLTAQGGIATGLVHALVAMDMPGAGSVFTAQKWSFRKPVYIGDTIGARATVKAVYPKRAMAKLDIVVSNQLGEHVVTSEATVLAMKPDV